jgi:hypothetical protein
VLEAFLVQKGVSLLLFPFMFYYEANHYLISKGTIFKRYLQEDNKARMEQLRASLSTNRPRQRNIKGTVLDFLDFRRGSRLRYETQLQFAGCGSVGEFYLETLGGIGQFIETHGVTHILGTLEFKPRVYSNESLWDKLNNSFVFCDSFDFLVGSSLFLLSRCLFRRGKGFFKQKFN